MKICPVCGFENEDLKNTCTRCGTSLKDDGTFTHIEVAEKICPALNEMIKDRSRYDFFMLKSEGSKMEGFYSKADRKKDNIKLSIGTFCTFLVFTFGFFAAVFILSQFVFYAKPNTDMMAIMLVISAVLAIPITKRRRNNFRFHSTSKEKTEYYLKKEKREKAEDKAERQEFLDKARDCKENSLKRIDGFDKKYWNMKDMESMLEAFKENKALSLKEAYSYARKTR